MTVTLIEKIEVVAEFLKGWRFDHIKSKDDQAVLIGDSGQYILIKKCWRENGKLRARGAVLSNKINCEFESLGCDIGFTFDRKPHAQAAEIRRRLLPDLQTLFDKYQEEKQKENNKDLHYQARVNALLKAVPDLKTVDYRNHHLARSGGKNFELPSHWPIRLDCQLHLSNWRDEINMELSGLPEDLAYKLLTLINEYMKEHYVKKDTA